MPVGIQPQERFETCSSVDEFHELTARPHAFVPPGDEPHDPDALVAFLKRTLPFLLTGNAFELLTDLERVRLGFDVVMHVHAFIRFAGFVITERTMSGDRIPEFHNRTGLARLNQFVHLCSFHFFTFFFATGGVRFGFFVAAFLSSIFVITTS